MGKDKKPTQRDVASTMGEELVGHGIMGPPLKNPSLRLVIQESYHTLKNLPQIIKDSSEIGKELVIGAELFAELNLKPYILPTSVRRGNHATSEGGYGVLGMCVGITTAFAQAGFYFFNPEYLTIPLTTNAISAAYEFGRYSFNRAKNRKNSNLENYLE